MRTPFDRFGAPAPGGPADERLPPGQSAAAGWPVLHYGPVPTFDPASWDFRVSGATAGPPRTWTWPEVGHLPRTTVHADLHCVTRFSVLDNRWRGIATQTVLELVPPAAAVTHVLVWAAYGYSASLPLADFAAPDALFATHRNGTALSRDHGAPLRLVVPQRYAWKGPKWARGVEYLTEDRRGFWEERGYHNGADPWQEQRWSYQEQEQ